MKNITPNLCYRNKTIFVLFHEFGNLNSRWRIAAKGLNLVKWRQKTVPRYDPILPSAWYSVGIGFIITIQMSEIVPSQINNKASEVTEDRECSSVVRLSMCVALGSMPSITKDNGKKREIGFHGEFAIFIWIWNI